MNKKGFTLIELIMVIAILGVLAAYAVPKLFDMTTTAQNASLKQIRVEIDSGLRMYGLDKLAANGAKSFPLSTAAGAQDSILDDYESTKLSFTESASVDTGTFNYNDGTTTWTLKYFYTTGTSYFLDNEFK